MSRSSVALNENWKESIVYEMLQNILHILEIPNTIFSTLKYN